MTTRKGNHQPRLPPRYSSKKREIAMASLLDLPLELLGQIVQETIPVDFEATALCCKTLFAASAPFQARYNQRRKRFRDFTFSERTHEKPEDAEESESEEYWDEITRTTGIQITTTRGLLEQIALDPTLPQYIQSIDLRGAEESEGSDGEEALSSLEGEVPESLRDLVSTSPFIEAYGRTPEYWIEQIRLSTYEADVFLLTLLAHVREISLPHRWDDLQPDSHPRDSDRSNKHLWSVLNEITHRANHPEEFPGASLSMLSVLQPSRESGYEEGSPLTPYEPFLAINSVSEVNLTSCIFNDDGYTGISFDPKVESYSKSLRKLNLTSCVSGAAELEKLLSRIPNLEILHYSHETKWHGCGYFWNIGGFLDTVQKTCSKTLKKLSVTAMTKWGNIGPTLEDLTHFKKLATLELDVIMLCGPSYDPSMRLEEGDEIDASGPPAWPKLGNMLPASIKRFNLYLDLFADDRLECISHLIEGLPDARAERLPHLKKLFLYVSVDSDSKIPDAAREVLNAAKETGFSILQFGTRKPLL
ncbi:hypothetical protein N7462_008217 [Penicillium macrosclerotiorum]|uniref:uncharacterized protein n=1 Tax=Penicillium macrosclerotiorum TaxID=303699 RepID=UPI0025486CFC|nr:uncharacterized protein N7462_008217 [Penicillium macrosclerotiorum]KAJ5679973.1 hypothetical protein N7462_008217 [Penicillium macrosclerotiorum]